MMLLLNFATAIGSRTVVVELGDAESARAILCAHQALGGYAALVEEVPRLSMQDHLAKHRRKQARAAIKAVEAVPNVAPFKRKAKQ